MEFFASVKIKHTLLPSKLVTLAPNLQILKVKILELTVCTFEKEQAAWRSTTTWSSLCAQPGNKLTR
jgi:hypothetical protein